MSRAEEFKRIESFLNDNLDFLKTSTWEIRSSAIRDTYGNCPICLVAKNRNISKIGQENWWEALQIIDYWAGSTFAMVADSNVTKLERIRDICRSESREEDAHYFEKCIELRKKLEEELNPTINKRFGVQE